jgi:ATP-dependent helicase YprA (DUF1998 family)
LRTLASELSASHPQLEDFADRAMAEIGRLAKRVDFAEALARRNETAAAESAAQAARLGTMIDEQADRLGAVEKQIREVIALCDLAEWAAQTASPDQRPGVLVADLRRVLTA